MTTIDRPVHELNTVRTSGLAASVGLMKRSLRNIVRLPSAFLPSIMMPIVQAIAFAGTFFAIIQIPGFPTDRSINWFMPLAVLMGSGFAGIGMGFTMIRDLETGFYDRLRMTPAPRWSLLGGQVLAAVFRSTLVVIVVVIIGVMFGARLTNGPIGLGPLFVGGIGMAVMGTGWGLGLAYRFRDMRAAAIMQLTFFLLLFLTEAQTPLSVMEGWLEGVARVNPFTNIIRLSRVGFVDDPITWNDTWGGLLAIAVFAVLTLWFAATGLSKLSDE